MSDDEGLSIGWKKAKVVFTIIGAILIPLLIAFIANLVNSSIKERELSLSYVKLAVEILQQEPKSETQNLRKWAIDVVNNYSTVKLSNEAIKELEKQELPKPIFKLARSPNCGVEKYLLCWDPSWGPEESKKRRAPECGIKSYNLCRHPAHGIEGIGGWNH